VQKSVLNDTEGALVDEGTCPRCTFWSRANYGGLTGKTCHTETEEYLGNETKGVSL